jgi:hypothetical protein
MDTSSPTITPEIARHALWHFGQDGGAQPGSFTQHLMNAIAAADPVNRARMRASFPDYVDAMELAFNTMSGIARLQETAAADVLALRCTCGDTDGPFKEIDGINLCEGCIGIADGAK